MNHKRLTWTLGFLLTTVCLVFLTSCAGHSVKSYQNREKDLKEKIVLLPFENLSPDKNAIASIMPVLKSQLEEYGFEVLDWANIKDFLCEQRVRTTGYISKELAIKIKQKFKANTVLVGSIISYKLGRNPQLGISARLINTSDGTILWADYASATGYDFAGILEIGRIRNSFELILKVTKILLASFSTEPPQKEIESTYKIAVMPFKNTTRFKNSGVIATYMFLVELIKNQKFIPVEYGMIRKSVIKNRIRYKGELDHKNTKALKDSLGADVVLVGTVESYSDAAIPRVAITARLLDAGENRILWYNRQQFTGEKGIIVFDWGRLRSADKVAYKVVSKIVKQMGKTEWY